MKTMEKELVLIRNHGIIKQCQKNRSAYRLHRYNRSFLREFDHRNRRLKRLIHAKGTFHIKQPFYCTYGKHIRLGRNVICGHYCVFEDDADIVIGNHVQMGNGVKLLTTVAIHDEQLRKAHTIGIAPIMIGDHVSIGHDVIIHAGVKIGSHVVIEDGCIIQNDIEDHQLVLNKQDEIEIISLDHTDEENDVSWFDAIADRLNMDVIDALLRCITVSAGMYAAALAMKKLADKKEQYKVNQEKLKRWIPLLEQKNKEKKHKRKNCCSCKCKK